jgi:putative tricarboxylic transport membrane protein
MTTEKGLRLGEVAFGLAVLALGAFIAFETWTMPVVGVATTVGPRLFPGLVAAGLILVGLWLQLEAVTTGPVEADGIEIDWPSFSLVASGLLLQIVLLETLGWILAGTLLFVMTARAFGSRRYLTNALIGLALTTLTLVVFDLGLDLELPVGSLFEPLLDALRK